MQLAFAFLRYDMAVEIAPGWFSVFEKNRRYGGIDNKLLVNAKQHLAANGEVSFLPREFPIGVETQTKKDLLMCVTRARSALKISSSAFRIGILPEEVREWGIYVFEMPLRIAIYTKVEALLYQSVNRGKTLFVFVADVPLPWALGRALMRLAIRFPQGMRAPHRHHALDVATTLFLLGNRTEHQEDIRAYEAVNGYGIPISALEAYEAWIGEAHSQPLSSAFVVGATKRYRHKGAVENGGHHTLT